MHYLFSLLLVIPILIVLNFHTSQAAKLTFRPKIVDYYGITDINYDYRNKKTESNINNQTSEKSNARELLTLGALGYIYHPNLISFKLEGTAGLQQSSFESASLKNSDNAFIEGYDFQATILPRHPYNLELFSRQIIPEFSTGFGILDSDRRQYQSGAILIYTKRPWTSELSYERTDNRASNGNFSSNNYRASLGYFLKGFYINSTYNYIDSTTSLDEKILVSQFFLRNQLEKENFRHFFRYKFDKIEEDFNERTRWIVNEDINADLTENLESTLSLSKSSSDTESIGPTSPRNTARSTDTSLYSLKLDHSLYKSLFTRFHTTYRDATSPTGETSSFRNLVKTDYRKKIPTGRLKTGILVRQDNRKTEVKTVPLATENDLPFTTVVGSIIPMETTDVDPDTISIRAVDIISNNSFSLTENLDYEIVSRVDPVSFRILRDILSLLPFVPSNVSNLRYRVSFTRLPGNFKIQANTFEYSLGLKLFQDFLTTSYLHRNTKQKLKEGNFTRGALPPDVTLDQFGITLEEYSILVGSTYSTTKSEDRNTDTLTYFANYYRDFVLSQTSSTNILIAASKTHFLKEIRDNIDFGERTKSSFSAGFDFIKSMPRNNLLLNITGKYVKTRGTGGFSVFEFDPNQGIFLDIEEEETQETYSANIGLQTVQPFLGMHIKLFGDYQYFDGKWVRESYSGNSLITFILGSTNIIFRASYTNSEGSSETITNKSTDSSLYLGIRRKLF